MTDTQTPLFTKHYRYKTKIEEGFIIRYNLSNDSKPEIQAKVQINKDKPLETVLDKQESVPQKSNKRGDKKTEMTKQSLQELRKYSNVNLKNIRIIESSQEEALDVPKDKKKKYKKIEKEGRHKDEESQEQKTKTQKNPKVQKNEKRSNKFNSYTDMKQIQQSRKDGNQIYFKGRIQFGEQNKSRGRIYCEQRQGEHVAQGDNCNRALHEDQVYFKVLKEDGPKTYCQVVGIISVQRQIVGRVEYFRQKDVYILNPINPRITSINIEAASSKLISKSKLNSHYYLAQYKGWNQADRYPTCQVIKQFGKFGDIDVETSSLLKNHNIVDTQYDQQQVRRELAKFLDRIDPITGQYVIPEQEIAKRQDLRQARIFTIDPLTARDFDDALSIQKQGEGYEVGVHIADASYFVEQDSFVDKQAKLRTTSVYLVHRVLPMLPRVLCENLCSLNPGCQRLTFTLWIRLDAKGNVIDKPRISRSVICSQARFTYEQAQHIIEGKIKSQQDMDKGFGCINPLNFESVAKDIKLLDQVAKLLRAHRIQRGSLFFDIPRKVFKLDKDLNPISSQLYERKQAHFLVEQLMILANEQVGQILVQNMGPQALLRRHKYPGPRKIQRFQQFMRKIKMPIIMSQTVRVQDQVNEILSKSHLKQSIKDIVKYEMINLLEAADYFLVGSSDPQTWVHYALNSPMYTHFTSPIRRYPDILVHRQLASIIKKQNKVNSVTKDMIDLCNQKKLQAKRVSNGCEKIFFCLYLRKNEVVAKAIIMDVEEWGIKLCVPKYDFKGTLRFKEIIQLKKIDHSIDQLGRKAARLQYSLGDSLMKLTLKDDQQVQIRLSCKQGHPLDYKITLLMPNPKSPGQHLSII